jgi:hypothetical protein
MTRRTGSANLTLHGGQVPAWLSVRMAALGRVIVEAIVHHYGRDELLRNPVRVIDVFVDELDLKELGSEGVGPKPPGDSTIVRHRFETSTSTERLPQLDFVEPES